MLMEIAEITETINECRNIKTLRFNLDTTAVPGQFVMVWLPGLDEVPMSLSHIRDGLGITVEKVGDATSALHKYKPGDKIGIRGPYGNGFEISGENILVIGGGSGAVPLAPLTENATENGSTVTAAIGAKSECDILFSDRLSKSGANLRLASNDGSVGYHGLVTEVAEELISTHDYDRMFACGPEAMLVRAVELAMDSGIPVQCSLERFMKCGIGLCGSCQLGKFTVCRDGPVFDGELLSQIVDFGKSRRSGSGKRIGL
jgi:dihydroorotate dehydrogenase electron transfer subunit